MNDTLCGKPIFRGRSVSDPSGHCVLPKGHSNTILCTDEKPSGGEYVINYEFVLEHYPQTSDIWDLWKSNRNIRDKPLDEDQGKGSS